MFVLADCFIHAVFCGLFVFVPLRAFLCGNALVNPVFHGLFVRAFLGDMLCRALDLLGRAFLAVPVLVCGICKFCGDLLLLVLRQLFERAENFVDFRHWFCFLLFGFFELIEKRHSGFLLV